MSDIFISYSRSDRATAQTLANALQREGWSVWWDPKIPPGKTFDEVIERALEQAKCVIVLWSKASVKSGWVKAEAAEGNRRGILLPALIEDDAKLPLEFRYIQASRLTDWQGEAEHTGFATLRAAVSELLGQPAQTQAGSEGDIPRTTTAAGRPQTTGLEPAVPEGVYLDPETKMMWTIQDNGKGIDWHQANQYAGQLRLGGYSDWRLPTIDELEKLCYPQISSGYKIRKPFQLTACCPWSSTKAGSGSAWAFHFRVGERYVDPMDASSVGRALCVRRSADLSDLENARPAADKRAGLEEVGRQAEGVYLDPETKLMWTIEDNGKDIDWHQANQFAEQLRLGGYSDWRLPTIEELEKLHHPQSSNNYEIRLPFRLTSSWVWSSTKESSDSARFFDFLNGWWYRGTMDTSGDVRAFCVRRSGE